MHVVAVDDEKLALDYLEQLLTRRSDIESVARFQDAESALSYMNDNQVDLIFLDIEMPGMNGLAMADRLSDHNPGIHIVFVTAHRAYTLDAFEIGVMDYLVKPIRYERLSKSIDRYKRLDAGNPGKRLHQGQEIQIRIQNSVIITDPDGNDHELVWRTAKAKELFLYLLHAKNRVVSKADIVETIWSGTGGDKAFAQLYTVVYHTRKALASYPDHLHLVSIEEGYRLEVKKAVIDIDQWEDVLKHADQLIRQGHTVKLENALADYQGDYLSYSSLLWPEHERLKQQLFWQETTLLLARYYEDTGQFERALFWLESILRRRPLDERIHLRIMKLYAAEKRTDLVHMHYERLQVLLKEELGVDPEDTIKEWYADFLQHR